MALLLFIIYIIFISLGLPDALLGSAWPAMYGDIGVSIGFASVIATITLCATAGISFVSGIFIRKYGTYKVVVLSVLATILGMLGIALSPNVYVLILFAIILGLGGGVIDAALNSFVSIHFQAKHLNFLHAFWGIGVSISPIIISFFIKRSNWRNGYIAVLLLQTIILIFVLLNRKQWQRIKENYNKEKKHSHKIDFKKILSKPALKSSVLSCGMYSALEFIGSTWLTSYLVKVELLDKAKAAACLSLYFGGIMAGRILSGFASNKLKDSHLKYLGMAVSSLGILFLSIGNLNLSFIAILLMGLGFAPIYPAQLHSIPYYFGEESTADITGFHMGGSYTIGFLAQLSFGFVAEKHGFHILSYVLMALMLIMFFLTLHMNHLLKKQNIKV